MTDDPKDVTPPTPEEAQRLVDYYRAVPYKSPVIPIGADAPSGTTNVGDATEDLADSIARQSKELWSHIPAELQPGDDDEGMRIRTDKDGNLMVRYGGLIFTLREGAGWTERGVPNGVEITCYRDRKLIRREVVQDTSLN